MRRRSSSSLRARRLPEQKALVSDRGWQLLNSLSLLQECGRVGTGQVQTWRRHEVPAALWPRAPTPRPAAACRPHSLQAHGAKAWSAMPSALNMHADCRAAEALLVRAPKLNLQTWYTYTGRQPSEAACLCLHAHRWRQGPRT